MYILKLSLGKSIETLDILDVLADDSRRENRAHREVFIFSPIRILHTSNDSLSRLDANRGGGFILDDYEPLWRR